MKNVLSSSGGSAYTLKPSIRGCVPARARFIHLLIIAYVWLTNDYLTNYREINCDSRMLQRACPQRRKQRNTDKPKETTDGDGPKGKLQLGCDI